MRLGNAVICGMLVALAVLLAMTGESQAKNVFTHRFIRVPINVNNDANFANGKDIIKRAAAAGYNGVFMDESKMPYLAVKNLGSKSLARMKEVATYSRSLNMAFAPMGIGQLTATISDINNGEAMPVKGTKFVVSGNVAKCQSDHVVKVGDGGFESGGWGLHGGGLSFGPGRKGRGLYMNNPQAFSFAVQEFKFKPHRAYRFTVWVKTENYSRPNDICVNVYNAAGKYYLLNRVYGSFAYFEDMWGHKPGKTSGWRQYTIDFNSLDCSAAQIRIVMAFRSGTGKAWLDDLSVKEVGLGKHETTIRSTMPVTVKSEDGSKTYKEGTDFVVGDEQLTIPSGSAIQSGDALRVDWFQRADMIGPEPAASYCHDEAWEGITKLANKMNEVFDTKEGIWVKYSEWRTAFWDPACHKQYNNSLPHYMGDVQKKTNNLLRSINKNCNLPLYLWSDTYDPYHNSHDSRYYQLNGISYGGWNYMDPKTTIVNWNVRYRLQSMMFFAGMDKEHPTKKPFKQILNVHDGNTGVPTGWCFKLDSAEALGMPDGRVIGINYCSWYSNNYTRIEIFAKHARQKGRWGSGPIPKDPVTTDCDLTDPDTGTSEISGVRAEGSLPTALRGFDAAQRILNYSVGDYGHVEIRLLNTLGQTTQVLVDGIKHGGSHFVRLPRGSLRAGVYVMRLRVTQSNGGETHQAAQKLVLF